MSLADSDLSVPLRVQTEDDEYLVDLDDDDPRSPSGMSANGKIRLKRRRRCGQCGPCQVKENCGKCHFCLRRDVLKQSCIYRKCIYLRSKPKPLPPSPSRPAEVTKTSTPIMSQFPSTKESADCIFSSPPPPPLPVGGMLSNEQSFGQAFHSQSVLSGGDFKPPFPPTPIPPSPLAPSPLATQHQQIVSSPHNLSQQCMSPPSLNQGQLMSPPMNQFPQQPQPHHQQSPMHLFTPSQQVHNNGDGISSQQNPIPSYPSPIGSFGSNQSPMPSASSFPRHHFDMQHGLPHPCAGGGASDMLKSQMLSRFPSPYCLPPVRPPENYTNNPFAHNSFSSPHPSNFPMYSPPGAHFLYHLPPMNRQQRIDSTNSGLTHNMSFPTVESDSEVMQKKYGCHRGRDHLSSFMCDFYPSRNSEVLSECESISVDDFRMNASIRSEGYNSLCIEIDEESISQSDVHSFQSGSHYDTSSLQSPMSNFSSVSSHNHSHEKMTKDQFLSFVEGNVVLKQDLGDDGIIQLEIPGNRVKIVNTPLDDDLAKYSSNYPELLDYIKRGPTYETVCA